ncbi:MAG: helix-turn-helix transcriptional regulator [Victivallales bacterium]|nr:helix-turn-helix transcriptional regulator [Victivallales bacterium]
MRNNSQGFVKTPPWPELFWCVAGVGRFLWQGRQRHLLPGQAWYWPSNEKHQYGCEGKFFEYRQLAVNGPGAECLFSGLGLKPGVNQAGQCPEDLFTRLMLNLPDTALEVQLENLADAFRILTLAAAGGKGKQPSLAERVRNLVEGNYQNPNLNVERIATLLAVSRVAVSRAFSQTFNTTLIDYLRERRLSASAELLQNQEMQMPIREISDQCGFSSERYFITVFKHRFGVSPGRARTVAR